LLPAALEKQLCNQSSQYEKYRKFSVMKRKPSCAATESTLFAVSKDEWNTKEGTGTVSPQRIYCTYFGMPKGTFRARATSNSEKIKCIALAIVELCWSEGIRQAIS